MEEEDIMAWDFAKKARGDAAIHEAMAERKSTGGGASDPAAIGHHGHTLQFQDVLDAIRRTAAGASTAPKAAARSRSSWPSTKRPKPARR